MTSAVRPRPGGRRSTGAFLAGALALAGLGACGVPLEDHAAVTPGTDLPYELEGAPPPDSNEATPGAGAAAVFLVRDDRLGEVPRTVSDPSDLNGLLTELAAPLTTAETGEGLRRALNDIDLMGGVTRAANVASVDLDPSFDQLAPHEQVLALGQIVFTLTERDEVDRVRFTRNAEPITIPVASGSLVDGAVTRYDYRSLR